jgi:deoxyribonuclease-4
MRLGVHVSSSGGAYQAFARAQELGCETMLIFTKSNRQWNAKPLTPAEVESFHSEAIKHSHIRPVAVHASYLINIASPKEELWEKSVQALKDEVERAGLLGIPYLTFHPGSHMDTGAEAGLAQIAKGLNRVLQETQVTTPHTTICLETMAGQGTNLGAMFEHLGWLISACAGHERLGVCFDTCHVFSAGYDIRTPETYAHTMSEFDRLIGFDRLKCFHFNDSEHGLGSHKDRHAHIGQGHIGAAGFANFVNDPRWRNHGAHLETDKTETGADGAEINMDLVNLQTLRELRTLAVE